MILAIEFNNDAATTPLSAPPMPSGVAQLAASAHLRRQQPQPSTPISDERPIRDVPSEHSAGALVVLQEWDGIVRSLGDEAFNADLFEIAQLENGPVEEGVFPLSEVQPRDKDLLEVGASFRYLIGRRTDGYGSLEAVYLLYFRRLPRWTEQLEEKSKNEARHLLEKLGL